MFQILSTQTTAKDPAESHLAEAGGCFRSFLQAPNCGGHHDLERI